MHDRVQVIEWLKAMGIFIIVLGHLVVAPLDRFTYPIYPKQLGVALFIFVLGWNLARETRDSLHVIFHRMFPMYVYGLGCAVLVGIPVYLSTGNVQESNVLPYVLGVNVFFDFFPANPTTWFIGTYFHALLFWFFLARRFTVRPRHILLFLVAEMGTRALAMHTGMSFVAYMLLTSWMTPFFLGVTLHRRGDLDPAILKTLFKLCILMGFIGFWGWLFSDAVFQDDSFPFKKWAGAEGFLPPFFISTLVSIQYAFYPLVLFQVFRRLSCPAFIRFISRNTLVIFIGHMPLIYALAPVLYPTLEGFWVKRLLLLLICLLGLGLLSEAITRALRLPRLQQDLWAKLQQLVPPVLRVHSRPAALGVQPGTTDPQLGPSSARID